MDLKIIFTHPITALNYSVKNKLIKTTELKDKNGTIVRAS